MPRENTHLCFCDQFLAKTEDEFLQKLANKHKKYFLLGSVAPDAFLYSFSDKISAIQSKIHGLSGEDTSKAIFFFLDKARKEKSEKYLAFAIGFLSHFALDMTFHPAVMYLSGAYYNDKKKRSISSFYRHTQIETYLDTLICPQNYWRKIKFRFIKKNSLYSEFIKKEFDFSRSRTAAMQRRQIFFNRFVFRSKILFYLFQIFKIFLNKRLKALKSLFYENLKFDKMDLKEDFKYKNIVSGEALEGNFNKLWLRAEKKFARFSQTAIDYYEGKIDKKTAKKTIQGDSLVTSGKASIGKAEYFWEEGLTRR